MTATAAEAEPIYGRLGEAARAEATGAAARLLGTYFADAPTWTLEQRGQLSTGEAEVDALERALRLRVALAAARRLDALLHEIAADLSFRYRRVPDETVGMVRGRLDVQRYLRSQGQRQAPRRYPVRVVEHFHATPENALAVYAAGWVLAELNAGSTLDLPPQSPERRELRDRRSSLARTYSHPVLADAREEAERVWRSGSLDRLLDQVDARVEGGHLARPEPYGDLTKWVRAFDPRATASSGAIEWAFYDERFDTKLFEIWMLHRIAAALEPRLGTALTRPLWERAKLATYTWKRGAATVALHFQRSLSAGGGTRWRKLHPSQPFDGVPDITVAVRTARSGESLAYVDAKLRQRDQHPTEELYKLLGYFNNAGSSAARTGAIVYYAPGQQVLGEFIDDGGGRMLSVGADPALGESGSAVFDHIADLVVNLLTEGDPDALSMPAPDDEPTETSIAAVQEKTVSDMLLRSAQLAQGTLEPFENLLASQLPEVWAVLDEDVRTILVTAEFFGASAPDEADFSGPLLGLSAACERLLCGEGMLFSRVAAQLPLILKPPVTLGSAAFFLTKARKPKSAEQVDVMKALVADKQSDLAALLTMAGELLNLNDYRRAAAHVELIDKTRYRRGRALILGAGDRPVPGLLARLVDALRLAG